MIIYSDMVCFPVLGHDIYLFSDETSYGWHTWAEIDSVYYFVGNSLINIETAMDVYEFIFDDILSKEDREEILIQNTYR